MQDLVVYGPIDGPTGYDTVTRNLVQSLYELGINIQLVPFSGWSHIRVRMSEERRSLLDDCIGNEVRDSTCPTLQVLLPEQARLDISRPTLNYTMCEASKIPDNWVPCSSRLDMTIVPSEYSQSVWGREGIKSCVVPLGVESGFRSTTRPLELSLPTGEMVVDRYQHRILLVGEDNTRKNLRQGILSFLRAFEGRSDVCLLLKTSNYSGRTEIEQYIHEARYSLSGGSSLPAIIPHYQILPPDLVPEFFALGTGYFSVSHGEGADLSAMQSLAMGRPILVPEHTGYLQYIADGGELVTTLPVIDVPVEMSGVLKRIYNGASWYNVVPDDVIEGLRKLVSTECSSSVGEVFRTKYSWRNTASQLLEVIRGVSP